MLVNYADGEGKIKRANVLTHYLSSVSEDYITYNALRQLIAKFHRDAIENILKKLASLASVRQCVVMKATPPEDDCTVTSRRYGRRAISRAVAAAFKQRQA